MVNGMGGTPLLELYILYQAVAGYVAARGGRITRNLVGNYITSLEMQGFSVTACSLDAGADQAVGRAGGHARPAVGTLGAWTPTSSARGSPRPPG